MAVFVSEGSDSCILHYASPWVPKIPDSFSSSADTRPAPVTGLAAGSSLDLALEHIRLPPRLNRIDALALRAGRVRSVDVGANPHFRFESGCLISCDGRRVYLLPQNFALPPGVAIIAGGPFLDASVDRAAFKFVCRDYGPELLRDRLRALLVDPAAARDNRWPLMTPIPVTAKLVRDSAGPDAGRLADGCRGKLHRPGAHGCVR
jgi:hypothetical protein